MVWRLEVEMESTRRQELLHKGEGEARLWLLCRCCISGIVHTVWNAPSNTRFATDSLLVK
jgi:hypothetical protein